MGVSADHENLAVPVSVAARLAGVSERRLVAWDRTGLVSPSIRRKLTDRNIVRLYSFQNLVELRVLRALHERNLSSQNIGRVMRRLRSQGYAAPLRQLVYAVSGREIFFQHPDGDWEGGRRSDLVVLHEVLDLEKIRLQLKDDLAKPRFVASGIERRRRVVGSKPVLAGTRTPVSAISAYIERGYTDQQILEAFPHLTVEDVARVRSGCLLSAFPSRQ